MEILYEKLVAGGLIVLLSSIFGFLPLALSKKFDFSQVETTDLEIIKKQKKQKKNVILSFLLNLGGGVLIANCFCHWLPEVREGIQDTDIDTVLPLAEVIMCGGFLAICLLEETLHHFLHPHSPGPPAETSSTPPRRQVSSAGSDSETELSQFQTKGHQRENSNLYLEENKSTENAGAKVKSALRTFFVISALSFHSTVEGMALSLEEESPGVWMNLGAVALHKFVIAFSVGVELVAAKVTQLQFVISILVFSFAPAVGVGVALAVTELSASGHIPDLPLQILQGIATGTVIYVVFLEILPKAKTIGGTGFQHVTALILGFAIFLPSLFFHSHEHEHEHEHEDTTLSQNITLTSTTTF